MSEEELNELYQGLLILLREYELEEIADQVEAIISEGKIQKKKIRLIIPDEPSEFALDIVRGTSQNRLVQVYQKEDFTPVERITLLLDVIDATIIDVADVKDATLEIFTEQIPSSENTKGPNEIYIYNDISQSKPIVLSRQKTKAEVDALAPLKNAILQIRSVIKNVDSK
jgi:hypothetical protein